MTPIHRCVRGMRFLQLFSIAGFIFASIDCATAQQPAPAKTSSAPPIASPHGNGDSLSKQAGAPTTTNLTDDLLDLLTEPTLQKPPGERRPLQPSDVNLDGEDLGEQSANPLQAVRQSMLIAAGLLERGRTDANTQQLQSDIVTRLNELIDELDRPPQSPQSPPPSPSQNNADQRDRLQQQQQSAQSRRSQARQTQSSDSEQQAKQRQPNGSDSGEFRQLAPRSANVQLADPRALQQQVWGQLPERTRQQMQSRMVEQFLPSYRQEIEAYYRALAK